MPSNIIIVSRQCYLLCESINYISVQEHEDDRFEMKEIRRRGERKRVTKKERQALSVQRQNVMFQIMIDFVPLQNQHANQAHSRSSGTSTLTINVRGEEACLALFKELVQQIREQIPDQLFLDKLVEKLLIGGDDKK